MPLDAYAEGEIRAACAAAAPLLAVAEVEAGGRVLVGIGGRAAPPLRYRPHVFFRRLRSENRAFASAAGLAAPRPAAAPATRDARAHWALFARAQRVDREAAYAACEWGFGFVPGEEARSLGFESAEALAAAASSGVRGQARLLLRRLDREAAAGRGGWRAYAARRGGEPVEAAALAERLAAAEARWRAAAPAAPVEPTLGLGATGAAVLRLQRLLRRAGWPAPQDGAFGAETAAALRAAQAELGLARDGLARPEVWAELGAAAS